MTLATVGSVVALIISVVGAMTTIAKAVSDRRAGVNDQKMSEARYGLDSLTTVMDIKDKMIQQLRDENADLRKQLAENDDPRPH